MKNSGSFTICLLPRWKNGAGKPRWSDIQRFVLMDLSIFTYPFMQNALLCAFFGGIACSVIGVFVVLLHMPFIGVCMSHAAFAGALLGLWLGFDPLLGAFALSLASAAVIGPLAHRGALTPQTSVGIIFSLI